MPVRVDSKRIATKPAGEDVKSVQAGRIRRVAGIWRMQERADLWRAFGTARMTKGPVVAGPLRAKSI
jgi:hypothetical protein